MDTPATLPTIPPQHPALDYEGLRKEGLAELQRLAGATWTDYNPHDPGVTILEMLCFALTEAAYRTDHGIQDLLAEQTGSGHPTDQPFFPAREALPSAPVTVRDYRKLLIDLPFVRNAWLEKTAQTEPALFYDADQRALSYQGNGGKPRITIPGLYDVLLEFEEHPQAGGLTRLAFQEKVPLTWTPEGATESVTHEVELEIEYPVWDRAHYALRTPLVGRSHAVSMPSFGEFADNQVNDYFAWQQLSIPEEGVSDDWDVRITQVGTEQYSGDSFLAALETAMGDLLRQSGTGSLIEQYNHKIIAAYGYVDQVADYLHRHRNVGQDFYALRALRVQEIGLTLDLEIPPGADAVQVFAACFDDLSRFLSSPLAFRSLEEHLDHLTYPDEVFEGPLLQQGFLRNEELDTLDNRTVLYTSDMIRRIMDLPAVAAVLDLQLSNYISNKILNSGARNCLQLAQPQTYKPRLSIEKSVLRVHRLGEPEPEDFSGQWKEIKTAYLALSQATPAENSTLPTAVDLPIPQGTPREVAAYDSIQEYFPKNYGIGSAGLPSQASEERHTQAQQLKGYLTVFDQLLSNHGSQLAHLKDLLSFAEELPHTQWAHDLQQDSLVKDLLTADYPEQWNGITETEAQRLDKRNRLLDHLLARFGENLSEYDQVRYPEGRTPALLQHKIHFLKDQPRLSRNRNLAYNQKQLRGGQPDVWDTENVSGLERRIAARLGLLPFRRQSLPSAATLFRQSGVNKTHYQFVWPMDSTPQAKTIPFEYEEAVDFEAYWNLVNQLLHDPAAWELDTKNDTKPPAYVLRDGTPDNKNLLATNRVASEQEAWDIVLRLQEAVLAQSVGFHMVEHVLLRPLQYAQPGTVSLLQPSLLGLEFTENQALEEVPLFPYHHHLSFFFPKDLVPFQLKDFKGFTERILEEEVPAHLVYSVYWLSNEEYYTVDTALKPWLEHMNQRVPLPYQSVAEQNALHEAHTRLVDVLNTLHAQHHG